MKDTAPWAQAAFDRLLGERAPAERMLMAFSMFDTARQIVIAGIRAGKPGISEEELRLRILERTYAADLPPKSGNGCGSSIAGAWAS